MKFREIERGFSSQYPFGELIISADELQGFQPLQLFIASIATCSGTVFQKVLNKMRYPYDDLAVKADIVQNQQVPNQIEAIHLTFQLKTAYKNEEKAERALTLTNKYCTMVQSVQGSIRITESVQWIKP